MEIFITVTTREWEYSQECVKTVERLKKFIKEAKPQFRDELQKILEKS